ncbi:hypothetical protein [Clostridium tyrobutyricum]|uniref:hypothetical protein n=1 Tax=Clostridium tyrobutyricum TaxID=1519 RepID=UPI0034A0BA3F
MKSVEIMSKGSFAIGPASLYTSIKKLLDGGLIKLTGESHQKKFILLQTKVLNF